MQREEPPALYVWLEREASLWQFVELATVLQPIVELFQKRQGVDSRRRRSPRRMVEDTGLGACLLAPCCDLRKTSSNKGAKRCVFWAFDRGVGIERCVHPLDGLHAIFELSSERRLCS